MGQAVSPAGESIRSATESPTSHCAPLNAAIDRTFGRGAWEATRSRGGGPIWLCRPDARSGRGLKRAGAVPGFFHSFLPLVPAVRIAFVYGPVAAGRESARSDVDVMEIGNDVSLDDAVSALAEAQKRIGREVSGGNQVFAPGRLLVGAF